MLSPSSPSPLTKKRKLSCITTSVNQRIRDIQKLYAATMIFSDCHLDGPKTILKFIAYLIAYENNLSVEYYKHYNIPHGIKLIEYDMSLLHDGFKSCACLEKKGRNNNKKSKYMLSYGIVTLLFQSSSLITLYHIASIDDSSTNNNDKKSSLILGTKERLCELEEFVHSCLGFIYIRPSNEISVSSWYSTSSDHHGQWNSEMECTKRELKDLMVSPPEIKEALRADIEALLESRKDYDGFEIPYIRFYLLLGISGSGKFSTVFTLASHFDYDLFVFSTCRTTDIQELCKSITDCSSTRAIFLIQDIDHLFNKRNDIEMNFSQVITLIRKACLSRNTSDSPLLIFCTSQIMKSSSLSTSHAGYDSTFPCVDFVVSFGWISKKVVDDMYQHFFPDHPESKRQDFLDEWNKQKIKVTKNIVQKVFFQHRNDPKLTPNMLISCFEKEMVHLKESVVSMFT